jgi:hypothetical protein
MTLHNGKQLDLITDYRRMLVITCLVLKVEMWKGAGRGSLRLNYFRPFFFLSEEMKNNVRRHSFWSWKPRDTLVLPLRHSLRSDAGCVVMLHNATLCQSGFVNEIDLRKLQQYVVGRVSDASVLITITTLCQFTSKTNKLENNLKNRLSQLDKQIVISTVYNTISFPTLRT